MPPRWLAALRLIRLPNTLTAAADIEARRTAEDLAHSYAGRMGHALIRCSARDPGIEVVGATEAPGHASIGQDAGVVAGMEPCGVPITDDLRTVLQEMIYKSARLVRHGRRYVLRFSRGDPGYTPLARCYTQLVGA